MAKKCRDLRARMSEASRARANGKAQVLMDALPLAELRQARRLSQEQLAELLSIRQPAIGVQQEGLAVGREQRTLEQRVQQRNRLLE